MGQEFMVWGSLCDQGYEENLVFGWGGVDRRGVGLGKMEVGRIGSVLRGEEMIET